MAQSAYCKEVPAGNVYILRLTSERDSISQIEPFFNNAPEFRLLDKVLFYNIMIAVTEGVNNAIIHGNQLNPAKIVELSALCSPNEIVISITDEGDGFKPEVLADPTKPDNLMREGGRGVFLMRALTKSLDFFSASGRSGVVMRF